MKNLVYKVFNLLIIIYSISIFLLFALNLIRVFLGCDMYSGDDYDIENFYVVGMCCDSTCDQSKVGNNIWLFHIWEYQMRFAFFIFNFCTIFILFFSTINFIKDCKFIIEDKLPFKNIFKKLSFYGLFLSIFIFFFVLYKLFFNDFDIFYLNLF